MNAGMADAVRKISIERGHDPRSFTLVAFGGAGPVHAGRLAQELDIGTVIIPPNPGAFSALGPRLHRPAARLCAHGAPAPDGGRGAPSPVDVRPDGGGGPRHAGPLRRRPQPVAGAPLHGPALLLPSLRADHPRLLGRGLLRRPAHRLPSGSTAPTRMSTATTRRSTRCSW